MWCVDKSAGQGVDDSWGQLRVLELGAGTGFLGLYLAKMGAKVSFLQTYENYVYPVVKFWQAIVFYPSEQWQGR